MEACPDMQRTKDHISRKVLIVDDEIVNRELLGFIVSRDYEVLYAENGREALDLLRLHRTQLSLVLLDLLMPEIDGYQVLEVIREDTELSRIPVIVLTSEKSAEVRSLQLGAADFITKPYDLPEVILARVRRSIELAERSYIIRTTELDSLTGLYTREYFLRYCERIVRYNPEKPMDAVVLNINRFHLVNEINGHAYGDRVLRAIGNQLQTLLSGNVGLACRRDADTFCVFLEHQDDYQALLDSHLPTQNARLSLRIGIYENVDKSIGIEACFDRAASACNTNRRKYQTSITRYDDRLHERELYNERLMNDMEAAVDQNQFKVYYQPKYDITGDIPHLSSAEALIRWNHPEFGFISPGVFVPLFEENGLIHKLDHFVWREAAAQIARWKAEYGWSIPVSINVSRIDIYDPALESELLKIAESNHLSPAELLLEVTESAYTDDSVQIVDKVNQLRKDGFHIEMDDFGAGYSSLNMLTEMPIDALKLDMSFIRNICTNPKDAKMVELVLGIAEFLGVPAIAEGVEDADQYQLLKKMGCDIIQGYYFSKPVPPEEFAAFIQKELNL